MGESAASARGAPATTAANAAHPRNRIVAKRFIDPPRPF
jgi:hypothetical protein